MARQLRLEYPESLWHITMRGNEKRDIYADDNDRTMFLELLGESVVRFDWILYAYVLMSNHYHLFQGRFKGKLVEQESYFLEVLRYVVLNPVRASMVSRPEEHVWSSHNAVIGVADAPPWLAVDNVLASFGTERAPSCAWTPGSALRPDCGTSSWEGCIWEASRGSRRFARRWSSSRARQIIHVGSA